LSNQQKCREQDLTNEYPKPINKKHDPVSGTFHPPEIIIAFIDEKEKLYDQKT
jgi:hypothetical protein